MKLLDKNWTGKKPWAKAALISVCTELSVVWSAWKIQKLSLETNVQDMRTVL